MSKHRLIARKVQTSKSSTYASHDCDPYVFYEFPTVPCATTDGVQDPVVGSVNCGFLKPVQNICLAADKDECAIGLNSKRLDPLLRVSWDERAPQLKCVFDLDKIDTTDQLAVYGSKFSEQQTNTLMGAFCGKHVSQNCAPGLEGGCSRYLSVDPEGSLCREWLATQPRDKQDALMRDYCLKNDTEDCKCINRSTDPAYNHLKELGNYFSDNCWYKPCANSQTIYLVPHTTAAQQCASSVCQQIIDVHTRGAVDISGNLNTINCSFDGKKPQTPDKPEDTSVSVLKLDDYWILIGAAITLVVAIALNR